MWKIHSPDCSKSQRRAETGKTDCVYDGLDIHMYGIFGNVTFLVVEKTLTRSKGQDLQPYGEFTSQTKASPLLLSTPPSLPSFPCSPSSCTWCSEHISPTAAIILKWHYSFQPSLWAQWLCWIDDTHLAAGSSPTPDKESLTEHHLFVWTCCRRTVVLYVCLSFNAQHFLFVLSLHIYHCVPLFADTCTHTHSYVSTAIAV